MARSLVVLVSGTGTLLQTLIDAIAAGTLDAEIAAVGADRRGTLGIERARSAGIATFEHPLAKGGDRAAWDRELTRLVGQHEPDLVVSAGFMKLVGPDFLDRFGGSMINTHPAMLPAFPGMHGPRDALAYGVKVTGATVFVVDAGVDSGTILAQEPVRVRPDDTVESLHERIKTAERQLLVDVVAAWPPTPPDDRTTRTRSPERPEKMTSPVSDEGRRPIRRALLSVYDKTGLAELAQALVDGGAELVSTGTTAKTIEAAGLPVTPVEQVTGFPECLDGRVKTLHPKIHAGLLADLRLPDHQRQLEELDVAPFELVVSNLYPFADTVASGASLDECVEQIDIGGPSMVRAAAKNHPSVAVVTSPDQYDQVLAAVAAGGFTLAERQRLAAAAFVHTATYDVQVASWMGSTLTDSSEGTGFPSWLGRTWTKQAVLRYGENPHQSAALYRNPAEAPGLAGATQLHGKEMSYNNYVDADAARRAAYDFDGPAVAIIKHANPCGIAVGEDIADAHRLAHACDPVSAFGGVIAANRPVSVAMAEQVKDVFTEVVLAPGYEDGAVEILNRKKNIRILVTEPYAGSGTPPTLVLRDIDGGVLVQSADLVSLDHDQAAHWQLVTGEAADAQTLADLEFAWKACRSVKSNAILLASGGASVGVGMGQVNRVDSARLAVSRAGDRAAGSVGASDAFFPFADGLEILLEAGVKAVVEPGGSVRDEEVIAAAKAAGATLYFTGARHFFH